MKRPAAILMTLLSPGVVFLALTMCCILMMQCQTETHCHEMDGLAISGTCCSLPDAGASGVTLHASHFTLTAPESPATPAAPEAVTFRRLAPASATPLDSSPLTLTLRL
jgi:hypothetical protein